MTPTRAKRVNPGSCRAVTVGPMTEADRTDPYRLYTRAEAASFLRVSEKWVDVLVKRGELYSITTGKRRLFPRVALTAFVRGEKFAPDGELEGDDVTTWPPTPSIFNAPEED